MIARELQDPVTPLDLYLSLRSRRGAFLLESRGPGGRYTFVGAEPDRVVRCRDGIIDEGGFLVRSEDPLAVLREIASGLPETEGRRFCGGFVGYFAYDLVRAFERVPRSHPPTPFPDFELGLFLDWVEFDHGTGRKSYHSVRDGRPLEGRAVAASPATFGPPNEDMNREGFEAAVHTVKREIYDGEAFQVVLSRSESMPFSGDLAGFYARLAALNPSPYMYFMEFEDRAVVGSSPEMLVRVEGREISTFPIAGTRPIGRDAGETRRLGEEMLADEKERAEHNMLVDLARNDVGRVARFGSVRVPEHLTVEEFSHVQHLVSRVTGEVREGVDALDVFASLFPAGTVSGAPKLRAMEIIDRLEASSRGPYAGAVGYLSLNGDLDTAIAIRTLFASGGIATLRAGAGIVADSVPAREWEETEHKLAALKAAVQAEVAA
ncbi:MAG TPA: anthranilate synthase component I family protein [Thermoplasmata archaeon]|nr:anthranilate synthase component I family protein [Thermoplasmata archaeon]